jgi:maleamate amidohydrolase
MTDATHNYANVYDNNVGFGQNPALIMVDFAHAYFDIDCPLFADVEDALESALRVRDAAHHAGIPVFLTRVISPRDWSHMKMKQSSPNNIQAHFLEPASPPHYTPQRWIA